MNFINFRGSDEDKGRVRRRRVMSFNMVIDIVISIIGGFGIFQAWKFYKMRKSLSFIFTISLTFINYTFHIYLLELIF